MDYKNSRIYRIICDNTNEMYIGSTCQSLSKRLAKHVSHLKLWKKGKSRFISSFPLLERGNYKIVLIEEYPCENKEQLCLRERHYIEQYPECVNRMRRPIISIDEKKESVHKWLLENKENYQNYSKQYLIDNRDELLKKKNQIYYCNCGSTITIQSKSRHEKSLKHQQYLGEIILKM